MIDLSVVQYQLFTDGYGSSSLFYLLSVITMSIQLVDNNFCFACGKDNPHSLKLSFTRDGETNSGEFTPLTEHQGFAGIAHGGVLTTVMDEAMAWVLWDQNIGAVAAKLEVRFRKPALIGERLCVKAWKTGERGRTINLEASLSLSTGEVVAEAVGTYMRL